MMGEDDPPRWWTGQTRDRMIGPGLGQISEGNARELDRQILAFRAVEKLHHPVTLWLPHPDADYSFEDYEEAVEYAVGHLDDDTPEYREARAAAIAEITSFQVCAECKDIEKEQAAERGYEHADWPCRTARCWLPADTINRPTEET